MRLFVYGTLMHEQVLRRVIGTTLAGEPAWLTDYRIYCVKGQHYPAMAPSSGDVAG